MKELRDIKNRYDFSLDTRQAVLIVSGLILMLMLSFLMGTLFGRNLAKMSGEETEMVGEGAVTVAEAPVPAKKDSAAPEKDAITGQEDLSPKNVTSSRDKLIEELESMKVPERVEEPAQEPVTAKPPMMAKMSDTEEKPAAGQEETKPAKTTGPEPEPAKKPEPEKVKRPVVPAGSFTIQLASLPDKSDADLLVEDLTNKRYDAYMLQVSLPGKGTFYRVRVGHYEDLDQARKALKILQAREGKYYDAWITQ